jgi:hypothetical protein
MTTTMLKKQKTLKVNHPSSRKEFARTQSTYSREYFSSAKAEALYDNQMITTLNVLQDLTNDIIKELCRAFRKPGGGCTLTPNL